MMHITLTPEVSAWLDSGLWVLAAIAVACLLGWYLEVLWHWWRGG